MPTRNDTPVMRQFLAAKAEHPDAILFFRLGDFYEMFFEDAVLASQALDLVLTTRDKNKPNPVPMCGVPHHAMRGYVARLVEQGHKVAICEQVEDPRKVKGIVKREVTEVVTPGVILDTTQLRAKEPNFLLALCGGAEGDEPAVGLAYLDASTGEFLATELASGEALSDELARIRPSQVLLPPGEEAPLLGEVTALAQLPTETAPEGTFSEPEADGELLRQAAEADWAWLDSAPRARRACAAVVRYLQAIFPRRGLPPFRIVAYSPGAYQVLDEATIANLEIFETLMERRRKGSLLGVMDHTVTPMGGRLLHRSLAFPLCRLEEIHRRQEAVEYLMDHAQTRSRLRELLRGLYDLERLNRRVVCMLATPRDLGQLMHSLLALPELVGLLEASADGVLEELPELLRPPEDLLADLARRLAATLVDDPPVGHREGGIIRPGFSVELDELVATSSGGKEQILAMERRERERTGISKLRIKYNKVFGYTIEVSRAKASEVPDDYVRKQTLVNVERFITPELSEHEAKVLGAEERRVDLEERLFLELREEVSLAEERIGRLAERLAHIDLLTGFAEVSARHDYCRPLVDEGDRLVIREGRHPVVERIVDHGRFVPNSVSLSTEDEQLVIVTGPNMAGKSTIIRQVALITLMAHTGCFVPARSAQVGLVDRIFTRVGASDNLARGQSTFMVEMRETAHILRNATRRSLIVLDEIGRGTSTYDGVSIAWAVGEYLHDRIRAKTLFATHFHELCGLADVKPRVRNRSVAVREHQGEVVFLHKLERGGSSRSHGIGVGKLAGLPHEVVERARQILGHLERGGSGGLADGAGLPLMAPQLSLFGELAPLAHGSEAPVAEPSRELTAELATHRELLARLRSIDPDDLTPRQAQQVIYELLASLEPDREDPGSDQGPG